MCIVTSRLGGQEWRRTETPDAVGVRARRWVLRLGLVLAAGAAGLAVSAGAAQADSGLGGTLDHVVGTVAKVTGSSHASGSHSSHSGSKGSTGSHASGSTHRTGSVRVTAHRAPVRAVTRPVVRTVQRVARPVVQPAHRATPTRTTVDRTHAIKAKKAAKAKKAEKARAAARAEQAEQTRRVTKTLAAVQRTVLQSPAHAVTTPPVSLRADLVGVHVAVDVPTVSADLGLPAVHVPGLDLPVVHVPGLDLPVVQLPPTSVEPPVVAPVRHHPTTRTAAVAVTHRHAPVPSARTAAVHLTPLVAPLRTSASTSGATAVRVVTTDLGPVVAATSTGLPWSLSHGITDGSGLGLVPAGSSAGAGPTGPLLLGLAVAAGLVALRSAHGRTPTGLVPQAFRLPRQPGFSPD